MALDALPSRPLAERRVLLTRAADASPASRALFSAAGALVIELPALVIGPPDDWGPLDAALRSLERFHWLIFSSANGVEAVRQRLDRLHLRLDQQPDQQAGWPRLAAVGRKTAQAIQHQGWPTPFVPQDFVADSLLACFPEPVHGRQLLLPRVQSGGRPLLAEQFRRQGATVVEAPAYESRCPATIPAAAAAALTQGHVDVITFTSSKIVRNTVALLAAHLGERWQSRLAHSKVVSIGPETSRTCRALLGRVDAEANPHQMEALVAAAERLFHIP
ncbi:MAG: uroporphyrinogen-III synthase [Candidatus Synechococcus spongiarum SP3]|uniref:Uroporphyrinogen-III synthase n=1 Tax=Candidatus Synechococcus spongiarum SP3 TaxID=1604020 RepID=A0A0G2HJV4_9SYNE|nr:MAG: uroporphyrinogen-III synthase [Candidatus Synechococcus spongiarum SP3]